MKFFDPDPVSQQLSAVLDKLASGERPSRLERAQIDVKEEPGRRGRDGSVSAGRRENEEAAKYLAGAMACLANTRGGGAIVLGVADDGTRIGTQLDPDWLRHRIWQLTEGKLTIAARAMELDGVRILLLITHEAMEPIRYAGRVQWRVDANCVDIDPTSWHAEARRRAGFDWSAERSAHTLDDVSPVAAEIARRYLRAAATRGDQAAEELASATTPDLLRRLNVVDGEGRLTHAGTLLFVGTPDVGIDYVRREIAGGDSRNRVRSRRPLLEQLSEVEAASEAANRLVHASDGFVHGQMRAIPARALREAIVNGVVHRDWLSRQPTTVEHVGDRVTVTSPGGFIGGIAPSNIITHPSAPRYRCLADAVSSLRLAEREGIGVDRMVRDMLARGHPEPEIVEIVGPYVRVSLVGGAPDERVLALLAALEPATSAQDVDVLLLLTYLSRHGWIDVARAAPVLQRSATETAAAIAALAAVRVDGTPVIVPVHGVPPGQPAAHRLGRTAATKLGPRLTLLTSPAGRNAMLLAWARARGRVSSTEVADLADLSVPYAGTLLTAMEEDGLLRPGRTNRRGRGFYYVPAT